MSKSIESPVTGPTERPIGVSSRCRPLIVLGGFLLLALLVRLGSFGRSVIDYDESLFMLLGRSLLRGDIPYTAIYEHSPVGGFALFAAIQVLLGPSVVAIRVATWLAAGLASFLVYLLAKRITRGSETAALIAGLLYVAFTLVNLGLAAHREMFLAPLVTFAALMILGRDGRPTAPRLLLAGIAIGCALQLKYMYVFEWLAIALMATLQIISYERRPARAVAFRLLIAYLLLGLPALTVVAGLAVCFGAVGHWTDFALSNFGAAVSYASSRLYSTTYLLRRLAWQSRSNYLVWVGVLVAPLYLLRRPGAVRRTGILAMIGWFVLALIGTMSTGRYWDHYYLQLVAPGSILTAAVLATLMQALRPDRRAERGVLLIFALAPLVALLYTPALESAAMLRLYAAGKTPPPDGPVIVSNYLRERVSPNDAIYVADYEPLVYYLVDARIPTRYAFPMHLTNPTYAQEGIPQLQEFRRIMDSRPTYVIDQAPPSDDMANRELAKELDERLARDYVLEKQIPASDTFSGKPISVQIYRLE